MIIRPDDTACCGDMTVRAWLAGQALACLKCDGTHRNITEVADAAVCLADAVILRLNPTPRPVVGEPWDCEACDESFTVTTDNQCVCPACVAEHVERFNSAP